MQQNKPENEKLRRFRAEAAELLEVVQPRQYEESEALRTEVVGLLQAMDDQQTIVCARSPEVLITTRSDGVFCLRADGTL